MAGHVHTPGPPLSDFVDVMWVYEGYSQPHPQERVLPSGAMVLVISLNENHAATHVAGAHTGYIVLDTSHPLSLAGVHFKPGGGFPFFDAPAGDLQDLGVPLDALWGRDAEWLREQLLAASSPARKFHVLERALIARAKRGFDRHPAVAYAVAQLESGVRSVTDVTACIGLSQRRFIEVFRGEVGLAPKAFSRVRRFHRALDALDSPREVDLTDVALACGYFDQAHFNHDFRAFAGVTPSVYLRQRASKLHLAVHD